MSFMLNKYINYIPGLSCGSGFLHVARYLSVAIASVFMDVIKMK
jgi:hypothetical protein